MPARVEPGSYLEDGVRLYRVLEHRTKGLLLLEDCGRPEATSMALTARQLREFRLRAVRAASEKRGVV